MGHVSPLQYDHIRYHVQQKIVIIMSTFMDSNLVKDMLTGRARL